MSAKIAMTGLAVVFLCGCEMSTTPAGPTQHESRSVDLDKVEMARVTLRMGAGNLNVSGGSSKLVDADFTYNVPSWKPLFRYDNTGVRGDLTIEQPSSSGFHQGTTNYTWNLRFTDAVPLDFNVHFGVGEGDLKLGSMSLRSVDMEMGVGQVKLDLRGEPKRSYDVKLHGGVGEATIYLPKDVGIEADAQGGIGGINANGLRKENGRYVNDAFGTAKTQIHLEVRGGVGSINLIAE